MVLTSRYDPGQDNNYVLLSIDSLPGSDCFCALVSVQQPKCPYFTSFSTATRYGTWQSMNYNTSMVVKKTEFPDGFLVVVIAAESNNICGFVKTNCTASRSNNLKKNLKVTIGPIAGNTT